MSLRFGSRVGIGIVFIVFVLAALFRVWVYQDAVQLGYRLSEREEERRRLRNEVRQLEVELAAERSPARLKDAARSLGLVPPDARQVLAPSLGRRAAKPAGEAEASR